MKQLSTYPFLRLAALLFMCAALVLPADRAFAQSNVQCFDKPGITNCLSGRILQFWQQNGGLSVFGYPISAQGPEQTPEGTFTTQYLERQRFELQPNNPAPYDVLLGRLGDQLLRRQGIDWTTLPKADPSSPNYFPQTGHSVSFGPFFQYWSANGLLDPTLNPYQRSLALFGLPLTEAYTTTNSSGDTVLTQWFERARFEFHPTNAPEYQVLLGLLGNEWRAAPPPPPPTFGITITSPAPNSSVGNPFTVTGTTNFVPNDNVLSFRVNDAANNLIGQGTFGVVAGNNSSQFSASIGFNPPLNVGPISLTIFAPSAEGPPEASTSIGLNFVAQQQSITIVEPTQNQVYSRSPIRVRGSTTVFPQRGVLHFVFYRPGRVKVGEGDFAISPSGSGSTFDQQLNFTAPSDAVNLDLEISDRDNNGNTLTTSTVRVYFNPGGYPPPSQQVITINTPAPGTTVARNFQAIGRTTGYPANGVLQYGVLDNVGQLIGQGSIFVEPADNGGTWAAEISFSGGNQGAPLTFEVVWPGGGPGQPPVTRTGIQLQCCLLGQ